MFLIQGLTLTKVTQTLGRKTDSRAHKGIGIHIKIARAKRSARKTNQSQLWKLPFKCTFLIQQLSFLTISQNIIVRLREDPERYEDSHRRLWNMPYLNTGTSNLLAEKHNLMLFSPGTWIKFLYTSWISQEKEYQVYALSFMYHSLKFEVNTMVSWSWKLLKLSFPFTLGIEFDSMLNLQIVRY